MSEPATTARGSEKISSKASRGDEVAEQRAAGADRQVPAGRAVEPSDLFDDAERVGDGEVPAAHLDGKEHPEEARLVKRLRNGGRKLGRTLGVLRLGVDERRKLPGALDVDGGPVGNGIGHGSPERPCSLPRGRARRQPIRGPPLERPMRRRLDAGTTSAANACGQLIRFHVGDDVTNLPQVRKGDLVNVTYYESVALHLRKPGRGRMGVTVDEDAARAQPGELPAGAVGREVNVTSKVVHVDRRNRSVTIEVPGRERITFAVEDPSQLSRFRAGDLVQATYREAIAVAVNKP